MLISQPDSSTSVLMFLPPGPISAPIFSGLILMVSMRGAYLLISLRGVGDGLGHFGEDVHAGDAGLLDRLGHQARAGCRAA